MFRWIRLGNEEKVWVIAALTAVIVALVSGVLAGALAGIYSLLVSYKARTRFAISRTLVLHAGVVFSAFFLLVFGVPWSAAWAFLIGIIVISLLPRL